MPQPRSFGVGLLLLFTLVLTLSLIGCTPSDSNTSTVYMFGFLFLGGLIILVFVVLIIWLLTRRSKGQSLGQNKDNKYLEIAKERYVKGEINHEQFEQIKKDLS